MTKPIMSIKILEDFTTYTDADDDWITEHVPEAWEAREVLNYIAELEGENKKAFDFVKTLRTYCIYAHWDNPDTEGEFNEFDAEICKWLSEFTECEK